jgi:hypothetical protein
MQTSRRKINQGTNGPSVEAVTALNAHKSTREKYMQRNFGKANHECCGTAPKAHLPLKEELAMHKRPLNGCHYGAQCRPVPHKGIPCKEPGEAKARTLERHSMQKQMYKREGRAVILDEFAMKRANVSTEGVGFVECRGRSPISFLCRRSIQTGYVSSTNKNAWTTTMIQKGTRAKEWLAQRLLWITVS